MFENKKSLKLSSCQWKLNLFILATKSKLLNFWQKVYVDVYFLATRLFNQFSFFSRRKKERSKRSPKISHLVLISPLEKDSKFFFRILEDREEVLTGSLHTWKAWSGSPRTTLSNRVTRSSLSGSFVPESVFRSDEIVPSEFDLGSLTISLSSSWCPRNESQTFRL